MIRWFRPEKLELKSKLNMTQFMASDVQERSGAKEELVRGNQRREGMVEGKKSGDDKSR